MRMTRIGLQFAIAAALASMADAVKMPLSSLSKSSQRRITSGGTNRVGYSDRLMSTRNPHGIFHYRGNTNKFERTNGDREKARRVKQMARAKMKAAGIPYSKENLYKWMYGGMAEMNAAELNSSVGVSEAA